MLWLQICLSIRWNHKLQECAENVFGNFSSWWWIRRSKQVRSYVLFNYSTMNARWRVKFLQPWGVVWNENISGKNEYLTPKCYENRIAAHLRLIAPRKQALFSASVILAKLIALLPCCLENDNFQYFMNILRDMLQERIIWDSRSLNQSVSKTV